MCQEAHLFLFQRGQNNHLIMERKQNKNSISTPKLNVNLVNLPIHNACDVMYFWNDISYKDALHEYNLCMQPAYFQKINFNKYELLIPKGQF